MKFKKGDIVICADECDHVIGEITDIDDISAELGVRLKVLHIIRNASDFYDRYDVACVSRCPTLLAVLLKINTKD